MLVAVHFADYPIGNELKAVSSQEGFAIIVGASVASCLSERYNTSQAQTSCIAATSVDATKKSSLRSRGVINARAWSHVP